MPERHGKPTDELHLEAQELKYLLITDANRRSQPS